MAVIAGQSNSIALLTNKLQKIRDDQANPNQNRMFNLLVKLLNDRADAWDAESKVEFGNKPPPADFNIRFWNGVSNELSEDIKKAKNDFREHGERSDFLELFSLGSKSGIHFQLENRSSQKLPRMCERLQMRSNSSPNR